MPAGDPREDSLDLVPKGLVDDGLMLSGIAIAFR